MIWFYIARPEPRLGAANLMRPALLVVKGAPIASAIGAPLTLWGTGASVLV